MNYEIENALRRKVDDYEFHSLKNEVNRLEHQIKTLENQIQGLNGRIHNYYMAIEKMCQMMIESGLFTEENQLYEIKNHL